MATVKKVSFTRMEDGTAEDYALVRAGTAMERAHLADGAMELLERLKGGNPAYQVTRYVHSLQTATMAYDDDADEELVVAALLHDIGETIAPDNHSAAAAAILRPYVSDRTHWVVQQHGLFQGYYYFHHVGADRNLREMFRDHPFYQACIDFCDKYDQAAFDPKIESRPLEFFEPMVRRIFDREPYAASKMTMGQRATADLGYARGAASS
ncbi:MAG: HD domain-containing protein [Chloroflexi bacterium]|nr:HD domain-containing protein [Chloroflexota bacterium]MCI0768900.1 HD domain-containing protein [Chloroflexota bacterium]